MDEAHPVVEEVEIAAMSEAQSAEIVPVQTPQLPKAEAEKVNAVQAPLPVSPSSAASAAVSAHPPVSLDSLSKLLAVAFAFLYLAGFLITSLHDFQYGFSEMNPFRPRILAAGGWFAISIAVPSAYVWELKRHSAGKEGKILTRFSLLVGAYMTSALATVLFSINLFSFDDTGMTTSSNSSSHWWGDLLTVLGFLGVLVAFMVVSAFVASKLKPTHRQWWGSVFTLGLYGSLAFIGYFQLFVQHSFTPIAIYFWFSILGVLIYFEFSQRDWTLQIGHWYRTLIGFFMLTTIFATMYYPHIKAKWGGGAMIPVELTFSKGTSPASGTSVKCVLIDETDAGFYVIGTGDAFAWFIPRSEISSIYYGQGRKNSVFAEGLSGEPQSKPNSLPAPGKCQQQISSATATRLQPKPQGKK